MSDFKQYRRKEIAELRRIYLGDDLSGATIRQLAVVKAPTPHEYGHFLGRGRPKAFVALCARHRFPSGQQYAGHFDVRVLGWTHPGIEKQSRDCGSYGRPEPSLPWGLDQQNQTRSHYESSDRDRMGFRP